MSATLQSARKTVVIVDDSKTMRLWLRSVLDQDPRLEVIGEAADALEARQMIRTQSPDVITLDVEMPGMDGLEFLELLMRLRPMPVVMVSGATAQGSETAVTALALGAVDCLLKPTKIADPRTCDDIQRRVRSAACSNVQQHAHQRYRQKTTMPLNLEGQTAPIILIGASTGGVAALETVLTALDPNGPPVVIVQHMPQNFLASFSRRLSGLLKQRVRFAEDRMLLECGDIVIAPEKGWHTEITRWCGNWQTVLQPNAKKTPHCPSVDALFSSAVSHGHDVIAALLTGLGRDGAEGLHSLRCSGARTLAQDKESCVIYGMPRVAKELGAVEQMLTLRDIPGAINIAARTHARARLKL
ncbi:chemotaxis response regulator protein-glutamate methylesterase [Sulfitobacter sp. SK012]|uniref:chemotaxis-specific protein-glutamate methyltransferase CheB n=1 Tax=Sulfitobacter sp. SK012 TaxID=1389005 RepID=UPI000E0C3880|nr:chemotaxis-specific protein-glutamate methyltransferase CheB [Sulfitobacter sp. SK012]AXI46719.1 chemotaxis response regulator protein-glutamate methylesterase [Sulfitobacter sp. SK012]